MKRPASGSTPKQFAYAQRKMSGGGESNKEIAKLSGFSTSVANNTKNKIENTVGYHNAMKELAHKSNNLMLEILSEFSARGLKNFDNKELIAATKVVSESWEKFNKTDDPEKKKRDDTNPLKKIIMTQRIQHQTINVESEVVKEEPVIVDVEPTKEKKEETLANGEKVDLSF